MNQSILECVNISYSAAASGNLKSSPKILKDISFNVKKNTILGIVGKSGSGKTTLGKIICGILNPSAGNILFTTNSKEEKPNIQFLFQNSAEIINPLRKVRAIIVEALMLKGKKDISNRIGLLLSSLGLSDALLDKYGYQLSGGERQRIALGRILAVEPDIIILDEPFSAQDIQSQINLYRLLLKLKSNSDLTIICISHNINLMHKIADEILVIDNGASAEFGENSKVFNSPESSVTHYLIKAAKLELNKSELDLI